MMLMLHAYILRAQQEGDRVVGLLYMVGLPWFYLRLIVCCFYCTDFDIKSLYESFSLQCFASLVCIVSSVEW